MSNTSFLPSVPFLAEFASAGGSAYSLVYESLKIKHVPKAEVDKKLPKCKELLNQIVDTVRNIGTDAFVWIRAEEQFKNAGITFDMESDWPFAFLAAQAGKLDSARRNQRHGEADEILASLVTTLVHGFENKVHPHKECNMSTALVTAFGPEFQQRGMLGPWSIYINPDDPDLFLASIGFGLQWVDLTNFKTPKLYVEETQAWILPSEAEAYCREQIAKADAEILVASEEARKKILPVSERKEKLFFRLGL